jgi:hypothetical protein
MPLKNESVWKKNQRTDGSVIVMSEYDYNKASILVLAFFSLSSSQPLHSQISLRRRESKEFRTMGEALGIPDSEHNLRIVPNENELLDKLLLNKKFRQ